MKSEALTIEIPKAIIKEAKRKGVDLNRIKAAAKEFVFLELIAQTSKLTKKDMIKISEKIKTGAWAKLRK